MPQQVELLIEDHVARHFNVPQMGFFLGVYHQVIISQRGVHPINDEDF
jgi:hypothetical protein